MKPGYLSMGEPPAASDSSLTAWADGAGVGTPSRCKVALVAGSGPHYTEEVAGLLRRRLRIAAGIALAASAVFLAFRLFVPSPFTSEDPQAARLVHALHALLVAVLTVVSAMLWSRMVLSLTALRALELCVFGAMAMYFGYLQYVQFHRGHVLSWAAPGHEEAVRSLATGSNSLRWFVLIVLYGTFIPNTWRRCATIVGILALTPLVLTFAICFRCAIMGEHTAPAMFEMMVILSMGGAIAIFGSYKISALEKEAYVARKLGQYQLLRRLGGGGMGEVYLGEHMLLRRSCAIKLIRPDQAGDPVNLSRFEREVKAMATLTHWNTVEIYDYGHAEDGTFYYVMEYLPGMTLQDLVDRHGPLPPARTVHFLRQICAGLQEAHAIGLIHRDIKPRNVIACQRGGVADVVKLLDFGLVQSVGLDKDSKLTIQGTILGSPPYISPEQALGKNQIDARTDIYSVGALAYFLLTGQPPFPRDTAMEMLVAHVHENVTPLTEFRPELPHDLQEVVLRCLQKNPDNRFQDIDSLDRALGECGCAGDWDRDQAAQWWKERDEAAAEHVLAGTTDGAH
jgi:tRNA A-37 threonylcarbamoyl transferase component Bud32